MKKTTLPLTATALHALAYGVYLWQVSEGGSVPNPASWTVWAFLAILNAITFAQGARSWVAALQFITGSVLALLVWSLSLWWGSFSGVGMREVVLGVASIGVVYFWWKKRVATYANLLMGGIIFFSYLPTLFGVMDNRSVEQPLAWVLWTGAYGCTLANGFLRRREKCEVHWLLMLITPALVLTANGLIVYALWA